MATITPAQAKRRASAWARDVLPKLLEDEMRRADRVIGAAAVNPPHMRDARGDVGAASTIRFTRSGRARRTGFVFPDRAPSDRGPLRKLTQTLAKSMRPGGEGHVSRVEVRLAGGIPSRATLRKGSTVPYARRHEKNPQYSYLAPAARTKRDEVRRRIERQAASTFRKSLVGAT